MPRGTGYSRLTRDTSGSFQRHLLGPFHAKSVTLQATWTCQNVFEIVLSVKTVLLPVLVVSKRFMTKRKKQFREVQTARTACITNRRTFTPVRWCSDGVGGPGQWRDCKSVRLVSTQLRAGISFSLGFSVFFFGTELCHVNETPRYLWLLRPPSSSLPTSRERRERVCVCVFVIV